MSSGRSTSGGARLHLWIKVVLTLLLVLIGGLRFARMDLLGTSFFAEDRYYTFESDGGRTVEHLNIDISQYLSMVEDFRGVERAFYKQEPYPEFADEPTATKGPVAPFINRPALPYLASLLPFDSPESFATVNLLLVVLGLWALFDALRVKGYSAKAQFLGGLLYVIALPVLVFASSLYIDGGTVGLLMIGYWLIVRRWWPAVVVFLPLSYTAKEVLILLAPVAAMEWRASGRSFRQPAFIVGALVSVVGWLVVGRAVQAAAPEPVMLYTVAPKLSTFLFNLGSLKSTLFFAIGMAPVVVPALLEIWRMQRRVRLAVAPRRTGESRCRGLRPRRPAQPLLDRLHGPDAADRLARLAVRRQPDLPLGGRHERRRAVRPDGMVGHPAGDRRGGASGSLKPPGT